MNHDQREHSKRGGYPSTATRLLSTSRGQLPDGNQTSIKAKSRLRARADAMYYNKKGLCPREGDDSGSALAEN
jgi:hypothetical protein